MKLYVASSWRNPHQPAIVDVLRRCGHDVYDFRHPPGGTGFSWRALDPDWQNWTPERYREGLQHPIAVASYQADLEALRTCDTCILVLPSGRSASWEFGHAMGQGKPGYVVMFETCEPELMYREAKFLLSVEEIVEEFNQGNLT